MSSNFFVNWAIMAVSLFNTILLLWLGLAVLLNAERRTPGIWLAGIGLLVGGAFFLSHSTILGLGVSIVNVQFNQSIDLWWHLGWIPVILSPCAWYVLMLWYTGFWEGHNNPIYRRHRLWFVLLVVIGGMMVALFIFASPLPSFGQLTLFDLHATPSILGVPVLILAYPLYILGCISLSLDALLRPGPTIRVMGNLARQRARPWLAAASFVLLLVSLLVGIVMAWIVLGTRQYGLAISLVHSIAWADLLISLLIAASVVLTGQAIASYEVFTGKTLPRRGLMRYWYRALTLAAGYAATISFSITLNLHPIYSLLLSVCLLVLFYALLSWRSYIERDHLIASLRPFVASQQLYSQLLTASLENSAPDTRQPFSALCENVLGVRLAYLVPLGSLAPLFGPPLTYPDTLSPALPDLSKITAQFDPATLCVPLEAENFAGASWAVPLWNERGLCGVLLLGEKRDDGLYSQEEIEIARSAGERLMDIQASAELARRLMALQRQQLAESQVLDRRTRRVLHDDVLPRLHAVLLALSSTATETSSDTLSSLAEVHHQIADLLRDLPATTTPEVTRLGLVGALEQVLQGELKGAFDEVTWQITPEAAHKADRISKLEAEVLFYAAREAIRNAARHARPSTADAPLNLHIEINTMLGQNRLEILIQDNGIGIEKAAASHGGSGQGLALHSTMLAVIGGSLSVENAPGFSTCIRLSLPYPSERAAPVSD